MSNSFYATGSFENFVSNYIDAKTNFSQKSIVQCMHSLNECFSLWTEQFDSNSYDSNITLKTLFSLLKKDDKPSAPLSWKIDVYKKHLSFNSLSFKDHLFQAFLMHIIKPTIVYPSYNKDYKLYYFLAQEIKYALFKIIRSVCQLTKRDYTTNKSFLTLPTSYTNSHISLDLYFLSIQNRLLYSVIISIIHENLSWLEIKNKYKLSKKQYKNIKNEVHTWISKVL